MGKEKDLERDNKDIVKEEKKVKKQKVNKNTQEYLDHMMARRKKIFVISIVVIILLFLIALALTSFSIIASVNNKIISGVTINGVDVSGLTAKEAEDKINKQIEDTKIDELKIEYEDYKNTIVREDLNINYSVKNAVDNAYKIGRDNNIILNNFKIISTFFNKEDIKIETSYNKEMLDSITEDVSTKLPGLVTEYTYCIEEDELIITPGKAGIALNNEQFKTDVLNRFAGNILNKDESTMQIPVEDKEPSDIDVEKIYEEIHSEPQDAYIKKDPFEIVVDKDGVDFDISNKSFKAQLKYANRINARFVCIIGEDEIKNNIGILKNMDTGEQINITLDLNNILNNIK